MRLVCISDTHGLRPELPEGDVLVHAGDLTINGSEQACLDALKWLDQQPHKHKLVIAGNHDFWFESTHIPANGKYHSVQYLQDSGHEIDGIKFWGSPITPWFYDWAFNRQRGPDIQKHWDLIPDDTNILITHGPPAGILDRNSVGLPCGCADLALRTTQLPHLRHHIFGHIHEGYGQTYRPNDGVTYTNCSVVDRHYQLVNAPVIIDL